MNRPAAPKAPLPVWTGSDGQPIACVEKIKVLNENYRELQQLAQDAFDDALLMGCDEQQLCGALRQLCDSLTASFSR